MKNLNQESNKKKLDKKEWMREYRQKPKIKKHQLEYTRKWRQEHPELYRQQLERAKKKDRINPKKREKARIFIQNYNKMRQKNLELMNQGIVGRSLKAIKHGNWLIIPYKLPDGSIIYYLKKTFFGKGQGSICCTLRQLIELKRFLNNRKFNQ